MGALVCSLRQVMGLPDIHRSLRRGVQVRGSFPCLLKSFVVNNYCVFIMYINRCLFWFA